MKYLITGGAGYIGSHMVNFLKKTNAEITILDNLSTGHLYNIIDCEFINLDLKDKDKLFRKYTNASLTEYSILQENL